MRLLLATTGLSTLAMLATPAAAETVISTATTAPVTTSSLGDIHVSSTGSIKPTTGVAVTINSSNFVKNEGTIAIQGANNSAGIVANPGLTGNITNAGTITIDENYTPTDTDGDGDIDGPFAQGSGRFGIHVLSGGTYTGNIVNSGTISIEGNQSAGIAVDSALTGSLTSNGKISVLGDNSVGIRSGPVSGNVTVGSGSSVTVQGKAAVGVLFGGNIGGALVLQGSISTTGYRSTTAPADTSKLDADDLLQGGSAVVVAGNVANGILLDTRPADNSTTSTDEDNDGIPDANETTATIASFGAAPAMMIGSSNQDINIGAVASSTDGNGLVIKGTIGGFGVYSGVSATGLSIGGTGRNVTIAGGMTVTGAINASATGANATAVHIGAGASVPQMLLSGNIAATGGGTTSSSAQAILIDSGATVNSIINSGAIGTTRSGTSGGAAAIVDKSGTLALIQNSGGIGVTDAALLGDSATAIDLSANTTGATVRQVAAASGKPAPMILGNILFGSGGDTLDLQAGSVLGKVDFGGGADSLSLTGATLFRGTLANSGGLAVSVGNGSTLDIQTIGAVNIASLNAGAGSTIGVIVGGTANTLYNVSGSASFGTGSKLLVTLDRVGVANGSYTILDAGTLTGAANLTTSNLPFLFNGTLTSDATAGTVSLNLQRKDSSTLGLNASEAAIFDAALKAADNDLPVAGAFLSVADSGQLKRTLQQLLPDHAGGVFETATKGSRLAAETLSDPKHVRGIWVQQVAWGSSKSIGDTSSYDLSGWGATGGYDLSLGGFGSVGVTAAYLWGKDGHDANELLSNHYEGGVYWRGGTGPLQAWARATAGTISFHSKRNFNADSSSGAVTRAADGKWNGKLYSGSAGASYEAHFGRLSIRPNASIEYYKLSEGQYTETGGGDAMDLTVRSRSSDETAANALMSLGYDLAGRDPDSTWLRLELEGGRRQILSGSLGNTVASFGSGDPFTLTAEERTSGWRGAFRFIGGGDSMSFAAAVNAEQQQGKMSIGARLGVNFSL
jgi:autotransporter-like protein